MLIGSQSTSTLMDVFRIGMTEVIRATGLPQEAIFDTRGCSLVVKGKDLSNRVDSLRIIFAVREGVTAAEIEAAVAATRLGAPVKLEDNLAKITVPPFEWRQLPVLAP